MKPNFTWHLHVLSAGVACLCWDFWHYFTRTRCMIWSCLPVLWILDYPPLTLDLFASHLYLNQISKQKVPSMLSGMFLSSSFFNLGSTGHDRCKNTGFFVPRHSRRMRFYANYGFTPFNGNTFKSVQIVLCLNVRNIFFYVLPRYCCGLRHVFIPGVLITTELQVWNSIFKTWFPVILMMNKM